MLCRLVVGEYGVYGVHDGSHCRGHGVGGASGYKSYKRYPSYKLRIRHKKGIPTGSSRPERIGAIPFNP